MSYSYIRHIVTNITWTPAGNAMIAGKAGIAFLQHVSYVCLQCLQKLKTTYQKLT